MSNGPDYSVRPYANNMMNDPSPVSAADLKDVKKMADNVVRKMWGVDIRYSISESMRLLDEIVANNKQRQDEVENQLQHVIENTTDKDIISAPEILAAQVGADGTRHQNLKSRLDSEHNKTTSQLTHTAKEVTRKTSFLEPSKLYGVEFESNDDKPYVITKMQGYIWGFRLGGGLYRRPLDSDMWELYTSNVPQIGSSVRSIFETSDGEVLLHYSTGIYKSSGWSLNSSPTISWDLKLEPNGLTTFYGFNVDGYMDKFIVGSYAAGAGYIDSRYIKISLDAGETWFTAFDSVIQYGQEMADETHIHGVAYDRWRDRFYFSQGHTEVAGVYCSEDDGQSWVRPDSMIADPAPTTIKATPDGLVCGSDHKVSGLYGVVSLDDITKQSIDLTWRWHFGRDGVPGFSFNSTYDEDSGLVYAGFIIDSVDGLKTIIAAGTPINGGLIYEWDIDGGKNRDVFNQIVVNGNEFLANFERGNGQEKFHFSAEILPSGVTTHKSGNIVGGQTPENTSIALGYNSVAEGYQSTVVGQEARQNGATSQRSVAIGNSAIADGSNSVAIGTQSKVVQSSVAIGHQTASEYASSVLIGDSVKNEGGGNAVAVGRNSYVRSSGVSLGYEAKSEPNTIGGVALGNRALAGNNAVALGRDTETTAANQVAFGERHLELTVTSPQGYDVPEGKGRLFMRKNGEEKLELCLQFSGSPAIILGTQS